MALYSTNELFKSITSPETQNIYVRLLPLKFTIPLIRGGTGRHVEKSLFAVVSNFAKFCTNRSLSWGAEKNLGLEMPAARQHQKLCIEQ